MPEYVLESDLRNAVSYAVDPTGVFTDMEVQCVRGNRRLRADNLLFLNSTLYANECKLSWTSYHAAIGAAKDYADILTQHTGQEHRPSVTYPSIPPHDVVAFHDKEGVTIFVMNNGTLTDVAGTVIVPASTPEELRANCISRCGFNIDVLFGDNKTLMPFYFASDMYDASVPLSEWENPTLIVADLTAGTGTFIMEPIARKFEAQVRLIPDDRQRIERIITQQVRYNDTRADMMRSSSSRSSPNTGT